MSLISYALLSLIALIVSLVEIVIKNDDKLM